jgi:hypothetical protein
MELSDKIRRWTGWVCLGMVAIMAFLGYLFGNIRFAPLGAGFAILAAVCLVERGQEPMRTNGIHPRRDSGVSRASG